ncbi:MAG: S49 family peptidase, partial [Ramlibacter sp.]
MTESPPPDFPEPEPRPVSAASPPARPAAEPPGWERATFEKLMFATLEEQRTARRWRSFIRLAWLAFFVFLLWALMHRGAPSTDKTAPHTAVIEIKGEISSDSDASAENVVASMRGAFEDEGAQA